MKLSTLLFGTAAAAVGAAVYSCWRSKKKPAGDSITKGSCSSQCLGDGTDKDSIRARPESIRTGHELPGARGITFKAATKGGGLKCAVNSAIKTAIDGVRRVAIVTIHPLISFFHCMREKTFFNNSSSIYFTFKFSNFFSNSIFSSFPVAPANRLQVVKYDEFQALINSGESPVIDISATYTYIEERYIIYKSNYDDPYNPFWEPIDQMDCSYYELNP